MNSEERSNEGIRALCDAATPWAVDLIDCGRDDGVQVCATWAEADAFRRSYIASAEGMQHCERNAILHRATPGTRLGYHDRAPYLAGPATPTGPEPATCEHGRTEPHRMVNSAVNFGCAVVDRPGPAIPEPTEETPPTRCDHGETGEHRWPCDSICDASGGGSCFTPWCKCRCHHGGCPGPGGTR